MAENKKISQLEPLEGLSGEEQIPVELGGKNYTITPKQIVGKVDLNLENGSNLDSIQQKSCTATGMRTSAFGNQTNAIGYYSHSEGSGTFANGSSAHAEGQDTKANQTASHTEGFNTVANNSYEHAEGIYNVSHTDDNRPESQTLSSIGIGTSADDRKNAQEVMQNGDFYVYGIGGYDGTNPHDAKSLQEVVNAGGTDFENLPTFDSITGQEKVIVVKDGKTQGLVTLTQIRQVVLPGYTYEDLSMDRYPEILGAIHLNTGKFTTNTNFGRSEIPVKKGQVVVITLLSRPATYTIPFGFTTESLTNLEGGDVIPFCNNGEFYRVSLNETFTVPVPDDAKYLVVDVSVPYGSSRASCTWEIQIGELIEEKLDDLNERVNRLE